MKTNPLFNLCAICAVSTIAVGAEPPKPAEKLAPQLFQIEIGAKFFTISASAARRLGLKHEPGDSGAKWPGILSESAYAKLLRLLNAEKSVTLLSSPRVTTKSGQRAVVEVIEEFRYPTAFEESGDQIAPAKFVTVNTGLSLEVEPVLSPGGDLVDLTINTNLTEFNRFAEGRTQKSEPIPKGGFSQPIFDRTHNAASVILRPGQTILLDGSEWTGSPGLTIEGLMNHPRGAKPEADGKAEPELLFVAITPRLAGPVPEHAGSMEEGGPVEITSEIVNISRDRLPAGVLKGFLEAPAAGPTAIGGVFTSSEMPDPRKALIAESGNEHSAAPKKVIAPGGRYSVEVTGLLRYPGNSAKADGGGNAEGAAKSETERMDFRIEVRPHAFLAGVIDLDITNTQTTSAASNEETRPGSSPGIASAKWKFDEDDSVPAARGSGRSIVTSVSIWNASTVMFVRTTEGKGDHVQVLLITAKMVNADEKAKADAGKWPGASPVPGKPGFVTSPYKPDAGYIDVRGFPKGTEVKDPYTGKAFLVP